MNKPMALVLVAFLVLAAASPAQAVDPSSVQRCDQIKSFAWVWSRGMIPTGGGALMNAEGGNSPLNSFTHAYFSGVQDRLRGCDAIRGPRFNEAAVSARLREAEVAMHEAIIAPSRATLDKFKGRLLNAAEIQQINLIKTDVPELTGEVNAIVADQKNIARSRDVAAATADVQSFQGRLLIEPEVKHLQSVRASFPELAARIDVILSSQDQIKVEVRSAELRQKEKAIEDERLAQERRRHEEEVALADQLAKQREEAKKAAFIASLPKSCRDADAIIASVRTPDMLTRFQKAISLMGAGEKRDACQIFLTFRSHIEEARSKYVSCNRDLDGKADPLAVQAAQGALEQATNLNLQKAQLEQSLAELRCQ